MARVAKSEPPSQSGVGATRLDLTLTRSKKGPLHAFSRKALWEWYYLVGPGPEC